MTLDPRGAPTDTPLAVGTERTAPAATTMRVDGALDLYTAPYFEQMTHIFVARAAPGSWLSIDLAAVDFIDSTGVGVLVQAWQCAERSGHTLRVTRPSEKVSQILDICGLAFLAADAA